MDKSVSGPVIMTWNEIEEYLTPEAYSAYEIWKKYHLGFGLPGGKAWDEQPARLMNIIETCETEYRQMRA